VPEIDVDDVLADPFIAGEDFVWYSRRQTLTDGIVTTVETALGGSGSIQPTGDNSLVRTEAYSMGNNTIVVRTPERLWLGGVIAGVKYEPDLVEFEGARYVVKSVDGYTQYGQGFVEAECTLFDYVSPRPS
jgi:hypothetical protein